MMMRWYLSYCLVKRLLAVGLLATVAMLTTWACSPTMITLPPETITITPPPETVTVTPTPTPTPIPTTPPLYVGLENPFPWDDTSAQEAGEVIFEASCAVCHRGSEPLGPEFSEVDYRQSLEEEPDFYFWTVSEGRLDTIMPAWADVEEASLSEEERWQALTYIWSLGGEAGGEAPATTATLTPAPPVLTGDPTSGQYIFQENCQVCHYIGGGRLIGPDLEGVTERREVSWLKVQIQSPSVHREQNNPISIANLEEFGLPMPDLGLTEQQVEAIIVYLSTGETGPVAIPAKYIPTLVIGLLAMVGITVIGLVAGTKRVEVRF